MKYRVSFRLIFLSLLFSVQLLRAQNATFNVTYIGFTAEAETAFTYASDLWTHYLVSDVPIEIVVHLQPLLPGQLGITFPNGELNFDGAPTTDVWYASCLANAIAGEDLSPGEADIEIYLNSFAAWYYGTDGIVPAGKYDFVSSVLHEICHGLGFLSLGNKDGSTGSFGLIEAAAFAPLTTTFPWPELDSLPSVYDQYLENLAGTPLISMENVSDALGTAFTSGQVYCNSPEVVEDNAGERARIYAPGSFVLGSSLSHWDEASYPPGNPNELMTPQAAPATASHSPGGLTLSLLDEIGWEIIYDTATTAIAQFNFSDVTVYPNPANDRIIILNHSTNEIITVEIFSMQGVLIQKLNTGEPDEINISSISPGNYFLRISFENNTETTLISKL